MARSNTDMIMDLAWKKINNRNDVNEILKFLSDIQHQYNFELSDKEIGLNISPNPVQDDLHINLKDQTKSIVKVKIYNIEGRLLKDCTFNSKQNKQIISLSNFNSGMYVATIFDENNKIYSVKFVKH